MVRHHTFALWTSVSPRAVLYLSTDYESEIDWPQVGLAPRRYEQTSDCSLVCNQQNKTHRYVVTRWPCNNKDTCSVGIEGKSQSRTWTSNPAIPGQMHNYLSGPDLLVQSRLCSQSTLFPLSQNAAREFLLTTAPSSGIIRYAKSIMSPSSAHRERQSWWVKKIRPFTIEQVFTVLVYLRGGSPKGTNAIAAESSLIG